MRREVRYIRNSRQSGHALWLMLQSTTWSNIMTLSTGMRLHYVLESMTAFCHDSISAENIPFRKLDKHVTTISTRHARACELDKRSTANYRRGASIRARQKHARNYDRKPVPLPAKLGLPSRTIPTMKLSHAQVTEGGPCCCEQRHATVSCAHDDIIFVT